MSGKLTVRRGSAFDAAKFPGKFTKTAWVIPQSLSEDQWIACMQNLLLVESGVQWWLGDGWAFGEHKYGERKALFDEGRPLEDMNFGTLANYGAVARAFETSRRREVLSFTHHVEVAGLPIRQQDRFLNKAEAENLSCMKLRSLIAQGAAIERTQAVEFDAKKLGKFAVLYADPPWQYENPPMGGNNRSIENHYPTMTLDEICALPVGDVAHENSVLFMWATSPKLAECHQVLIAWGFNYRTNIVWVKDKIGMGYHARERHELLLIAKRGEFPPPPVEARPDSVQQAPRLDHSAKPPLFYDLIDAMYPGVRKVELFGRAPAEKELWTAWGNQATPVVAAAE